MSFVTVADELRRSVVVPRDRLARQRRQTEGLRRMAPF